jgi:hypothetical protein
LITADLDAANLVVAQSDGARRDAPTPSTRKIPQRSLGRPSKNGT